ncbi:MAG: type IV secretory system conjugative DNA transfer family protein, partial [Chloroflexota bacterium]|nr:type IV secretory system conjugative DNA transfer family protein [Chloroflexota bacterium]
MMKKLYRLLTTLVTLAAVLAVAWLLLRDDVARVKDRALDATSDARKTAELGVAGVWMWGHQALLGPIEPPKQEAAPTHRKPRRVVAPASGWSGEQASQQQAQVDKTAAGRTVARHRLQPSPTPEPVITRAARGLVRGAIDATESRRDTSFPTEWYGRPLEQRWEQYQSLPWSPIRTATQYTFVVIGGLLALGSVRAAGTRRLLRVPRFLLRPLQIFVYSYFRPKLRASKTHGSTRWASLRELWGMRLRHGEPQMVLGRSRIGDWLSPRWVLGIPLVQQFWHAIVVAPPGAGKTVKFIIPSILRECRPPSWRTRYKQPQRRSFIVADLKGELTKKTSRAVRETHDTKLLSFLEPHLSVRYNHIAKIRTPIQAWTFAEVWVANTGKGREEFWEELSRGMIGNAALHLAYTKPGANLLDLYELLYPRTPEQIVEVFLSSPIKPVQDGAKGLMSSMAKNEKLVGAAYADMQRRIRSIGFVSQLAETTAFDELDLEAFGKKPTALYIKF